MYSTPLGVKDQVLLCTVTGLVSYFEGVGADVFSVRQIPVPPGPGDTERSEARHFPQGAHDSGR